MTKTIKIDFCDKVNDDETLKMKIDVNVLVIVFQHKLINR